MNPLINTHLSMLDLVAVREGGSVGEALAISLNTARHVEALGFTRYWLAEHHNMPGIASSATAVLVGHIAGGTSHIRVGSGGVMLPNHAPLVVAEASLIQKNASGRSWDSCRWLLNVVAPGLCSRNSFKQDSACLCDAYELFVTSPDVGMRFLGEPSECGIDLETFKFPARRQIQYFTMFSLVQGLALGVVAMPCPPSQMIHSWSPAAVFALCMPCLPGVASVISAGPHASATAPPV
jgi:hypothetical protein